MTPAAIEWNERMAARWSTRAAELRASADPAAQSIAAGLEWTVAGMRRDLAAVLPEALAPRPNATPTARSDVGEIQRHLAAIMPRFDATLGVTINAGPIMDAVRARLQARLGGVAYLPPPVLPISPPAEVVPFAMGPQLALFEVAA